MNNLNEKQNNQEFIDLLKLQRYKYNEASITATFNFILSVILQIILSLITLFNMPNNFITYINFLGVICTFVCLWLSAKTKSIKEKAAQIQYVFDVKLFGFKQNSLICNIPMDELIILSQKEKVKKLKGLNNWYSIKNNLDLKDAIFSCQQQNIRWDKKLRRNYLLFIIIICLLFIGIIITIGILNNLQFNTLWSYIFLLLPIISYCASFIFSIVDDLKQQKDLSAIIISYKAKNNISMTDLYVLEEKLFYYRKSFIKIPNWFFNIFRKSMQEEAENYSEIESDHYSKF